MDSVTTAGDGSYAFSTQGLGAGFYQLSLNDSDRVDIILDPREKEVVIDLDGRPLQHHVHVRVSPENMRLWEYKLVSREAQAVEAAVQAERATLAPTDVVRARQLDSIADRAAVIRNGHLLRVMERAPESYFSKVVGARWRLEEASARGPADVARAFDLGDPELLRSSVYANGLMGFLQSDPPRSEIAFYHRIDSLLLLTSRDTACFNYAIGFLAGLFSQYGPDLALQYLVDTYIAAAARPIPMPSSVRSKVDEQMKVSLGRTAPAVELPLMEGGKVPLAELAATSSYTALFFYSSTCDHCHEQMPGLRDVYSAYHDKGLQVVGIALDTDTAEFLKTLEEQKFPWRSVSEFQAWGSPSAKAFQVKSTPSFILIDRQLRIVAKPLNYLELATKLKELLG